MIIKKRAVLFLTFLLFPTIASSDPFGLINIGSIFGSFDLGTELCRFFHCFISDSVVLVIATLAIFFLGMGVFFGKINWGVCLSTGVGIILIASAEELAQIFVPGASCQNFFTAVLGNAVGDFLLCNNLLPKFGG